MVATEGLLLTGCSRRVRTKALDWRLTNEVLRLKSFSCLLLKGWDWAVANKMLQQIGCDWRVANEGLGPKAWDWGVATEGFQLKACDWRDRKMATEGLQAEGLWLKDWNLMVLKRKVRHFSWCVSKIRALMSEPTKMNVHKFEVSQGHHGEVLKTFFKKCHSWHAIIYSK